MWYKVATEEINNRAYSYMYVSLDIGVSACFSLRAYLCVLFSACFSLRPDYGQRIVVVTAE